MLIKNSPPMDGGVYHISSKDCSKCYIRQSGKKFEKRKGQHKYKVRTENYSSTFEQRKPQG